jgi:enoyl-CoA hydratase/carnithine racemase
VELKTIRYEQRDAGIVLLTLDRPDRLNAWTGRMHTELRWAMNRAELDDRVRVVVITGAGRGFCAGADTTALRGHAERGRYDPGTPRDLAQPAAGSGPAFQADFAWLLGLETVTIAAVNGPAAGVGLALACWCDLRFVAADAKLTTAHGRLNLPAEFGLSWLLPRLIGLVHANDLLLSSRVVLGREAGRLGLANRVVEESDRVVLEALDYARSLVENVAPASLATTKRQIATDQLHDDPAASVVEAQRLLDTMMTQPDYAEGVRAFSDKRKPQWTQAPRAAT